MFDKGRKAKLSDWVSKGAPIDKEMYSKIQNLQMYVDQFEDMEELEKTAYTVDDYKKNLYWLKKQLRKILDEFKI